MAPDAPFVFGCSMAVFPPEEIDALTKSGVRLELLAAGLIQPVDAADEHFLKVAKDEVEPVSVEERAWLRLTARRELERSEENGRPPPDTATAKDYGMVEFDADRCWW